MSSFQVSNKYQHETNIICIIVLSCTSCKKEVILKNESIIGKWQLVQTYDGYANGGNFLWTNTAANYSKHIEFSANGQFNENNSLGGSSQICTGTYNVLADSTLEKKSNCNTETEKLKISEQSETILILNYHVIEGVIKEKYIPVN